MREATTLSALLAAGALVTLMSMDVAVAADREYRYARADLASAGGAEHIYAEINEIAEDVCYDQYGGSRLVTYRAERERCIDEVVENLVADIDDPRLSRVHARYARR